MKYSQYLSDGLKEWPKSLCVSDGYIMDDNGGYFPSLNTIWHDVEDREERKGELEGLMSWAIFSGYHKAARIAIQEHRDIVRQEEVDLHCIHSAFNESFHSPEGDWKKYHAGWNDDYTERSAEQDNPA